MNKERLCFVENGIMYLTKDWENVHGDDWNDAPYEHNAEPPMDEFISSMIAFLSVDYDTHEPCERGSFSVAEINKGAIPWLYNPVAGPLSGGDDIDACIEWLKKAGFKWAKLHD